MAVQRAKQQQMAESVHKYRPSEGMCSFATNVRSLASSERQMEYNMHVMAQRSVERQMGNINSVAAEGDFADKEARFSFFKENFCDTSDNANGLKLMCGQSSPAVTRNADMDFGGTIWGKPTLEIDFADGGDPSTDEKSFLGLANNLYSHEIMFRLPATYLEENKYQEAVLDMKSIVAKRSIAENSFYAIAAMKAQGSENSASMTTPYMRKILEGTGMTDPQDIDAYLGTRPSYDAQMEINTKKRFQDPQFWIGLQDSPENVQREGAAIQAISMMQAFDTWQSYLRTEAIFSVILELENEDQQDAVETRIDRLLQ
jgi:hypothetical protein